MQKSELDIPVDDLDCWARYPKHRWVYETSRLLDSQNIKWSPVETAEYSIHLDHLSITGNNQQYRSGSIYVQPFAGRHLITEVYVIKGEIKHIRHFNPETGEQLPELVGELELRINAFVSLYFTKFSGVFTCHSSGQCLYKLSLRPQSELGQKDTIETTKLIKRLFRKNSQVSLNGLADRATQEVHAS